jgi:membrane-bound lytic murein transglycosylase D
MRLLTLLALLPLFACAPLHQIAQTTTAGPDSLQAEEAVSPQMLVGLQTARWHLLRAIEAQSCSLFTQSQQDLDQAFQLLAELESEGASGKEVQELGAAVERAYLALLPHLEHFSPDSPLVILLEGLSEEKIENLPADATLMLRIHQLSKRCDVPIDANAKVAASIHFFQTRGKTTYETWMKRAGRFRDLILDILGQESMPEDLLYVSMIESGFNPYAYSRAQAVGLWQFIESTGRLQGLNRDSWVDERRDPVKATRAAAQHLADLYGEFQDWRLALAAYNAGRGRVSRAIEQAGTRDFWQLDLPRETANYVPLFMAAAVISKDLDFFGFEPVKPDPPFSFDEVVLPPEMPHVDLRTAAKSLGITADILRDLNPELRQHITPPHSNKSPYRLRVPKGRAQAFFEHYTSQPPVKQIAVRQYRVKARDSLSAIARKFGVTSQQIARASNLKNPNRLHPGQILYIPGKGEEEEVAAAPVAASQQKVYTVHPGDTLDRIAVRHQVAVRDLMRWNRLRSTRIHIGDRLVVHVPRSSQRSKTADASKSGPAADGPKYHKVRPGESLLKVARMYGVSTAELQRWNALPKPIAHAGQRLLVVPPIPDQADTQFYTVVKGDTLASIARKFGLQARELARQNNISLSTTLMTGMTLRISRESN